MRVLRGGLTVRTLFGGAVLGVLVALVPAAPAGAATYQTTVSPDPFFYPETAELLYRLHITTAGQAERLRVFAEATSFPGGGWALDLDHKMTLEGPGTVLDSGKSALVIDRFCAPVLPDTHGNYSYLVSPTIEVEVPANSTSAVAVPARPYTPIGYAPWPGMDLAVEFRLGQSPIGQQIVRSPSPGNSGRHGMPISLKTDPAGVPGGCPTAFTPVDFGKDVLVSGRAEAAVAGELMTIRAVRSEPSPRDFGKEPAPPDFGNRTPVGRPVELARVRIGAGGTFAYRWRPTQPGDYTLGALYQSQSPQFASDFSVPTNLRVGCPGSHGRQPPRPTPSLTRPSARGRRRGRVIISAASGGLRLICGRPCQGRVTIMVRSARKLVAVRHTTMHKLCRWTKRYAIPTRLLPHSQRRRLANGHPVRLTVTARFEGSTRLRPDRSPRRAYRTRP